MTHVRICSGCNTNTASLYCCFFVLAVDYDDEIGALVKILIICWNQFFCQSRCTLSRTAEPTTLDRQHSSSIGVSVTSPIMLSPLSSHIRSSAPIWSPNILTMWVTPWPVVFPSSRNNLLVIQRSCVLMRSWWIVTLILFSCCGRSDRHSCEEASCTSDRSVWHHFLPWGLRQFVDISFIRHPFIRKPSSWLDALAVVAELAVSSAPKSTRSWLAIGGGGPGQRAFDVSASGNHDGWRWRTANVARMLLMLLRSKPLVQMSPWLFKIFHLIWYEPPSR